MAIRDTTSPPPAPVPIEADSIATATPWQHFVDRFGIVTAVGLLAIIAASLVAYNTGVTPVADASLVQLVLMIVVLGCMTVLALRTRR